MEIRVIRGEFFKDSTIGKLYIGGEYFSLTLEDAVRAPGIKIPKHTAIPAGRYKVDLRYSPRFNRTVPVIFNCDNDYELKADGISFTYVYFHGGNTHKNTDACVLVAYNRVADTVIQGTAEKELTERISDAIHKYSQSVWLEIS